MKSPAKTQGSLASWRALNFQLIRRGGGDLQLDPALPQQSCDHAPLPFLHWAVFPICKVRAKGQIISEVHFSLEIEELIFPSASLMKMRMAGSILSDVAGISNW